MNVYPNPKDSEYLLYNLSTACTASDLKTVLKRRSDLPGRYELGYDSKESAKKIHLRLSKALGIMGYSHVVGASRDAWMSENNGPMLHVDDDGVRVGRLLERHDAEALGDIMAFAPALNYDSSRFMPDLQALALPYLGAVVCKEFKSNSSRFEVVARNVVFGIEIQPSMDGCTLYVAYCHWAHHKRPAITPLDLAWQAELSGTTPTLNACCRAGRTISQKSMEKIREELVEAQRWYYFDREGHYIIPHSSLEAGRQLTLVRNAVGDDYAITF